MALLHQPITISADHAQFIQSGVSIILASANARRIPSVGRALGCRLSASGDSLELFLIATKVIPLLDDLRAGQPVAVTFTRPSTHRTLQIKAPLAKLLPARMDDRPVIARYLQDFTADVDVIMGGSQSALLRAALGLPEEVNVRLVLQPTALYEQTPGPLAGQALVA